MPFYIKYGMGGGYGGCCDWEKIDVDNIKDAEDWAIESAEQDFESSGEFDYEEFKEDNPDTTDVDEWEAYCEERDRWIVWEAKWFEGEPNE